MGKSRRCQWCGKYSSWGYWVGNRWVCYQCRVKQDTSVELDEYTEQPPEEF